MTESGGTSGRRQIRPAGDRAWLIEPGPAIAPADIAAALRRARIAGIEDILPAAGTVLVTMVSPHAAESVRRAVSDLLIARSRACGTFGDCRELVGDEQACTAADRTGEAAADAAAAVIGASPAIDVSRGAVSPGAVSTGTPCRVPDTTRAPVLEVEGEDPVIIPVHYVGEDLERVAELLGTSVRAVIDRHTSTLWQCEFVGFAPGFGYLRAPRDELSVPRRERARTSVPAGAVGLAGGYSAVYPRSSPGGWQLIGHTEAVLWDQHRDPPALIRAGGMVRFVEARR